MAKKGEEKKAKVHKELDGLELKINDMGEVESSIDIDRINKFLDKNVKDKKLDKDVQRSSDSTNEDSSS